MNEYEKCKWYFEKYHYRIMFERAKNEVHQMTLLIDFTDRCVWRKLFSDPNDSQYPSIQHLIHDLDFYEGRLRNAQKYIMEHYNDIYEVIPDYFCGNDEDKKNAIESLMRDRIFLENCRKESFTDDVRQWFITNDIDKYIVSDYIIGR